MAAIEVAGLTKEYGDVLANDDLTFSVEAGEVFGYLGPNGAGKTTTIRTLLGLQSPTAGTAELLGHDVRDEDELIAAKRRVGYLPADPAFDEHVTGREILDLHAAVKGGQRRDELLETFDPPLDRPVRAYSSGNRQMLGLVQAFMHDPDLVVLDEPTGGLDPLKQAEFNEFVRREARDGTTVFMSSHVLSEVRRVCDRVGVIRDGRLVAVEGVADLLRRSGKFVRLRAADSIAADDLAFEGVHDLDVRAVDGDGTAVTGDDGAAAGGASDGAEAADAGADAPAVTEATFTYTGDVNVLLDRLSGHELLDLDVEEAPLEEVFMRFYGEDEPDGSEPSGPDGAAPAASGGDGDA